jgi:hypothetical protein
MAVVTTDGTTDVTTTGTATGTSDAPTDVITATSVGGGRPDRKRPDWKLVFASLGVAVGVVLVVIGFRTSVSGREQQRLPDAIESIDPISGATQMPQQTRVFVDLQDGYEAQLNIDGLDLDTIDLGAIGDPTNTIVTPRPGEQIALPPGAVFEPGNVTLTFVPGEGQPFEAFATGLHTATVTFWKTVDGPGKALRYVWTFYVV